MFDFIVLRGWILFEMGIEEGMPICVATHFPLRNRNAAYSLGTVRARSWD
jgi:hypothetical protein